MPTELSARDFDPFITSRPVVFVQFTVGWSPDCRAFAPVYEEAAARYPDVGFGTVDVDAHPDLAARFELRGFPTVMAFRRGASAHTVPMALSVQELANLVDEVSAMGGA